jgi:hypothetical protein
MTWEHIFVFAQKHIVLRTESAPGSDIITGPKLPMSIPQYVSELGTTEGYEFAGSYPKDDGVVLVMKRQQGPEV